MRKFLLLAVVWLCVLQVHAQHKNTWQVYETARGNEHLLQQLDDVPTAGSVQPLESERVVFADTTHRFQVHTGMGGAVTDAVAVVYDSLSESTRAAFIQACFDQKNGLGYNLIRVPVHSCDFSPESYTYITEGDSTLQTFSIDHDRTYRFPLLQHIQSVAGKDLLLYASPWSPPAFMKTNKDMLHGGSLLPEYRTAWANYYIRFIQEYEAAGFPVWGLTVQNEPMAVQRWESCIYTAEEERDFVRDHLGPALHAAGMDDKKLIVWDHNRDLLFQRAATILNDPEASAYVWGVGFHWYETWAGGEPMFENVGLVNSSFSDKALVFTEGCNELFRREYLGSWAHAERYGEAVIEDLNHGTTAWTDWNLMLNMYGGPNHVGNYCFAPIHADVASDTLLLTPAYYYLGHFSRFIRPGAVRVAAGTNHSDLLTTAYLHPDGSLTVVVMNKSDQPISYQLQTGQESAKMAIPAHAIQTCILR